MERHDFTRMEVDELAAALAARQPRQEPELVTTKTGLPVRLSDVGVGISQILPVVVAALDPDRTGIAPWWAARSPSIMLARTGTDYEEQLRLVLRWSNTILFIDPHLDPEKPGYGDFGTLLASAGGRRPSPDIEIHRAATRDQANIAGFRCATTSSGVSAKDSLFAEQPDRDIAPERLRHEGEPSDHLAPSRTVELRRHPAGISSQDGMLVRSDACSTVRARTLPSSSTSSRVFSSRSRVSTPPGRNSIYSVSVPRSTESSWLDASVEERIVNGLAVPEQNHSQEASAGLRYPRPATCRSPAPAPTISVGRDAPPADTSMSRGAAGAWATPTGSGMPSRERSNT